MGVSYRKLVNSSSFSIAKLRYATDRPHSGNDSSGLILEFSFTG